MAWIMFVEFLILLCIVESFFFFIFIFIFIFFLLHLF